MGLGKIGTVQVDDVLHFLMSRSCAPSSLGSQIDRMRNGLAIVPDAKRAAEQQEERLLDEANLIRCVDGMSLIAEFDKANNLTALTRLQAATGFPQGQLAVLCLRSYQEWHTISPERGLAAVYLWLTTMSDRYEPAKHDEEDLAQAFRVGKCRIPRRHAAEMYADAFLALSVWVKRWNRQKLAGGSSEAA